MEIRLATKVDLPSIVSIYNSTVPTRMATADLEPVSVESRLSWFEMHNPERRPIWIADHDGMVVGWLSIQPFNIRPAYDASVEVSIYIDGGCRRQGIGSNLLAHAIHCGPRLGISTLLGLVFAHNEPSLDLFSRFGFQQWGYLPRVASLDSVERDLIIVGLHI